MCVCVCMWCVHVMTVLSVCGRMVTCVCLCEQSVYVLSGAVYMCVVERAYDLGQSINIFDNRYKFDNFFWSY